MILQLFNVFKVNPKGSAKCHVERQNICLTAAPLDNKRLHPVQPRCTNYDICGKHVQTKQTF